MDIQHLVDRLEDLIDEGRHWPLTKYTMIDEERALEIIDQMRISIPEQIEKATRIVNQRDRLIAQANEEATRMVDLARKKSEELVERDAIVQTAKHRAENVLRQAEMAAEQVRDEADVYVMQVLKELEGQLLRTLTIVRNGISKVSQEREPRPQQQPTQYPQQTQEPASPPPQQMMPPQQSNPPLPPSEANVEQRELVDADTEN
jgi:hypothetical protein